MADEITLSLSLTVLNGSFSDLVSPGSQSIDQSAIGRGGTVQTFGESEEEFLGLTDIASYGLCYLRNLSTTNYFYYGPDSGGSAGTLVPFGKLKPGEACVFRIYPGITLKGACEDAGSGADTCKVDVRVYED